MADGEGGGSKILRGLFFAVVIVAAIVLLVVFWRQVVDGVESGWNFVRARIPDSNGQRAAVLVFLILAALFGIFFSRAGHFTAYGVAMGLGPLLWFLFWEGFPPLGLHPTWTKSLGLGHLRPGEVVLFAIIAAAITTLVFVPLELRETYHRRVVV